MLYINFLLLLFQIALYSKPGSQSSKCLGRRCLVNSFQSGQHSSSQAKSASRPFHIGHGMRCVHRLLEWGTQNLCWIGCWRCDFYNCIEVEVHFWCEQMWIIKGWCFKMARRPNMQQIYLFQISLVLQHRHRIVSIITKCAHWNKNNC